VMWWELSDLGPLVAWTTIPMAIQLVRQVWDGGGRGLNPVLGGTARLCLWFAVTLGTGLIL
jgi:hypothetical protein